MLQVPPFLLLPVHQMHFIVLFYFSELTDFIISILCLQVKGHQLIKETEKACTWLSPLTRGRQSTLTDSPTKIACNIGEFPK